ncbi:hypothetical protein LCGC14_1773800, partial [marine sediment metagenome]
MPERHPCREPGCVTRTTGARCKAHTVCVE